MKYIEMVNGTNRSLGIFRNDKWLVCGLHVLIIIMAIITKSYVTEN